MRRRGRRGGSALAPLLWRGLVPKDLTHIPACGTIGCALGTYQHGPLAQLAEQLTLNQRVPGSSPGGLTTLEFMGGWNIRPPFSYGRVTPSRDDDWDDWIRVRETLLDPTANNLP